MRSITVAVASLCLIAPVHIASAPAALATTTGIEIGLAGNRINVVGHPSAPGATDAQVTGDVIMSLQGSTFVISVDPESGGGAQLWSSDPACTPSDGKDVMEIRCDVSAAIAKFGQTGVYVGVDLRGIDERGSRRLFALTGSMRGIFFGSPYADEFYGGDGGNHFEGNAGPDIFIGGAGEDVVFGGAGPDSIDVSEDKAVDVVDCNDLSSRGTDNQTGKPVNKVEYDKVDRISDCGTPGAPAALTIPEILADPVVGVAVQARKGAWSGSGLRFAYWWESCIQEEDFYITDCKARTQESDKPSAMTYTPKAEDAGRVLLFFERATNNFGSAEIPSLATAPVIEPVGPRKISDPVFGSTVPREDVPLSVDPGWWEWGSNIAYTWVMQACSTSSKGKLRCSDEAKGKIVSALDFVDYTPSDDDVDRKLRLVVTGTKTIPANPKPLTFTTVATSAFSAPVKAMGKVEIPLAWRPRSTDKGYAFTHVSAAQRWASQAHAIVPLSLDIVYIGVTDIKGSQKYASLLDEAQYLPLDPKNDGAILLAEPDFDRNLYGYPGKEPQTVTLYVYSRLKDLDVCSALVTDPKVASLLTGQPLMILLELLREEGCTNWKMEWSNNKSNLPLSQVENLRLVQSTGQGSVKSTIVITANRPKDFTMYLVVQAAGYDSVQALPEMPSLTWDGDIKAFSGTQTTLRVWPMLAMTGQPVLGAKLATVEVYDTNGFLQSSYTWDYRNLPTGIDMRPVTVTAPFTTPGTARILVRVEDANSVPTEVYVDIPVRAPTGDFITLDGRCFTSQGVPTTSCSAPVTEPAQRTAETLSTIYPDLAGGSTLEILRKSLAHGPNPPFKGNVSYSVNVVNDVFSIDKPQKRAAVEARNGCEWWNLVCQVVSFFTPRKARVAVVPKPQPAAPPVVVEQPVPSVQIGSGRLVAGLTDSGGCTFIGADLGIGCNGAIDGSVSPLTPGALMGANAEELRRWTGARLISDMGGAMTISGAPVVPVSAYVVTQSAGQLTIPAQMFGKTKF